MENNLQKRRDEISVCFSCKYKFVRYEENKFGENVLVYTLTNKISPKSDHETSEYATNRDSRSHNF
jgi:hypothetical protein